VHIRREEKGHNCAHPERGDCTPLYTSGKRRMFTVVHIREEEREHWYTHGAGERTLLHTWEQEAGGVAYPPWEAGRVAYPPWEASSTVHTPREASSTVHTPREASR